MDPLVSVVIPAHNRWPLVCDAVESASSQAGQIVEVVVVDDGSTDGTAAHLAREYPSTVIVRQANAERGAARNRGLGIARGRFVGFLDADDVLEPWYVSQFLDRSADAADDRVYVCGYRRWFPESGRLQPVRLRCPPRGELLQAALRQTNFGPGCMIVPRALALDVGGFPERRSAAGSEDWLFQIRIAATGVAVEALPLPGVRVREHVGRSVNDDLARIAGQQAALSLLLDDGLPGHELTATEQALAIAGAHRFCAAHAYRAGEMRQARKHLCAVTRALGFRKGLSWSARLWLQTWLGARVSAAARHARVRLGAMGANYEAG